MGRIYRCQTLRPLGACELEPIPAFGVEGRVSSLGHLFPLDLERQKFPFLINVPQTWSCPPGSPIYPILLGAWFLCRLKLTLENGLLLLSDSDKVTIGLVSLGPPTAGLRLFLNDPGHFSSQASGVLGMA